MKNRYELMTIAGDTMEQFRSMTEEEAKERNETKAQLNSFLRWEKTSHEKA